MADETFDRAEALQAVQGSKAPAHHGSKDGSRHFDTARHHNEATRGLRMERQDGSGRGHETEKRGGKGKANWGDPEDQDLDGAVQRAEETEADPGPDRFSPGDLVDDDKVMTIDEYEQQKKANGQK